MRRFFPALLLILAISVLVSCKKEKSFEVGAPAVGSLKSDNNGDCLPKTAVGAFVAGTVLSDSNYLEIDVDVVSKGSYAIRTDTVNGYSFSGIGNFTETGINHIRLAGNGMPSVAGTDQFAVLYDTSLCYVNVTVLPAGSSTSPSVFTLQGSGDSCMIAAVAGNYIQNQPLDGSNSVTIKVNATTAGTYTVSTNTVNDFRFVGSGTIPDRGEQTITLVGSGAPATEGSTVFTVTAGGTTCTFSVNVTPSSTPPPVTNTDHFPLTPNSFWTYTDNVGAPEDSTVVINRGPVPVFGNTYNFFEFTEGDGTAFDTAYYRKYGNDYFSYLPVDYYTGGLFDSDVSGEILFLRENLQSNRSWKSAEFSGTVSNIPVKLQIVFSCTDANASFPINGTTYTNIYKMIAQPQISTSGGPYVATGQELESYCAKGVGLIYEKGSINGSVDYESFLIRHKVF